MAIPFPLGRRRNRSDVSKKSNRFGANHAPQAVAEAVRGLAPDHRTALVETYFRGRSVRETATVLGVSPDLVKTRIYCAMRGLYVAISEAGASPAA